MSIQYITSGFNQDKERVVLWRLGNYQYQLEIAGKEHNFDAEYNDAIDCFDEQCKVLEAA